MPTKPDHSSFQPGPELEDGIPQRAAALDIPRSLVKRAVTHFIARQKHIAVLSDARKSLAGFKATGLGAPFSEAAQWPRRGAGKEEMPVVRNMRQ